MAVYLQGPLQRAKTLVPSPAISSVQMAEHLCRVQQASLSQIQGHRGSSDKPSINSEPP